MDNWDYLRCPIIEKKIVSCFDGEVPRSPEKWNWNWLYFLPFIFTFEQGVQEEVVNIWIFVLLAKQNISNDWEPKNSGEKPVQLAVFLSSSSIFLDFSQHLLNFCLDFLSSFKNRAKIQMFLTQNEPDTITWHVRSALCTLLLDASKVPVNAEVCKQNARWALSIKQSAGWPTYFFW